MASEKVIVVKVGGSFLLADGNPDSEILKEMASLVLDLVAQQFRVVVIVGGGIPARNYIAAASTLGANNGVKDMLGILVSRLNARLFIEALPNSVCYAEPPE